MLLARFFGQDAVARVGAQQGGDDGFFGCAIDFGGLRIQHHLALAHDTAGLRIEPSAAAGFSGPGMLTRTSEGRAWLSAQGLEAHLPRATHLAWTTGGLFVPDTEYDRFLQRGRRATSP